MQQRDPSSPSIATAATQLHGSETLPSAVAPEGRPRGASVGRYLVLSLLGRGGMGEVYAAYDPELDRRIALKLLRTANESAAAKKRLAREAWGLGRLSHPNVVQVYDVGEHEGDVFIAMELVEGEPLDVWSRGPDRPSWQAIAGAYLDAARGLAAAHEKGLVHRDVKPSNILRGKDGRVRVADFGLVTDASSRAPIDDDDDLDESLDAPIATHEGSLTATGALLGTPRYMPPEQLGGEPVSAASDQYSLCVALYESLYGAPPLAVEHEGQGISLITLIATKLEGPPTAPPRGSAVPTAVFEALVRGLATAPADRYPSMDALRAALTEAMRPQTSKSGRATAMGAALAAVVAVAGGVGWARSRAAVDPCADVGPRALQGRWDDGVRIRLRAAFAGTGRPYASDTAGRVEALFDGQAASYASMRRDVCEAGRSSAQSPAIVALREACLERRRGQLQALAGVLAEKADPDVLDKAAVAAGDLAPVAYCADVGALTSRVPPPEDPTLRARVAAIEPEVDRLEALYAAGRYADGLAAADLVLAHCRELTYAPLNALARYWVGLLRDVSGQYGVAKGDLIDAAALAADGGDDALVANAWARVLFVTVEKERRFDEASTLRSVGPTLLARAHDDRASAAWKSAEALLLAYTGRYAEGAAAGEEAVRLAEKAVGPSHAFVANALNNLAIVHYRMGDYAGALDEHRRVLAIRAKASGLEHPSYALALNNVGLDLLGLGSFREALATFEEARRIFESTVGAESRDFDLVVDNEAIAREAVGDWAGALPLAQQALASRTRTLGLDHALVGQSSLNVGIILTDLEDYAQATPLLERAVTLSEKVNGPESHDHAYALLGLSRARLRSGTALAAVPLIERALALCEKSPTDGDPVLREALLQRGSAELALHRPASAAPLLERALAIKTGTNQPEVETALAEALWASNGDRVRARALVDEARAAYARIDHRPGLEQTTRWLATHPL